MDKIVLSGLEFYARHGVFDAEHTLGARFVVDVELALHLSNEDSLSQTVDYAAVYNLVQHVMQGKRYRLIEALAHHLSTQILNAQPLVHTATVRVHKPNAPLPGIVRDVYAEVTRHR